MDVPLAPDRRHTAAALSISKLRSRLLDLTARNPLISFPHGRATGTRTHVRAVGGSVDAIFAHLGESKALTIRSLSSPDDEPDDEKQPGFRAELDAARLTDEQYLEETAALSPDELGSVKAATIERKLNDRVRRDLGLPLRSSGMPIALANYAARLGIDASFDLRPSLAVSTKGQGRSSLEFQALVMPDALERQLAKIRETARTVAEETGVSTLHLAFGFLEWFESDASDKPLTSPLLLLRVDIDRRIVLSRYQYSIGAVGDEVQVNQTLSERLSRDFRIKLPLLSEEDTPEAYLARVLNEVCKDRPRWAVRRFITLAHFPFARLAMFQDLDEDQWQGGLSSHPVLASLLGGQEAGEAMFAAEHEVDTPEVSAKVPVLVLDADASQHSAIYDAMCGKDLVIEGPPGTGKSQTITNIIAAALSNGKRVLFVADKQAALQVVKDRLDKVGLGDFCLELHSGKARKTDVLKSLEHRLERRPALMHAEQLDDRVRELTTTRVALTRYVDLLNCRFGALGHTVHDVLWADRRRRAGEGEEARQLDGVALPSAETLSASDISERRALLNRFESAAAPVLAACAAVNEHPWWGVTRSELPSVDMAQAVRDTEDTAASMAGVLHAAEALHPHGLPLGMALDDLAAPLQALASLWVDTSISASWFAAFASADLRELAAEWQQACLLYRASFEAQSKLLVLPFETEPREVAERLRAAWSSVRQSVPNEMSVEELSSCAADLNGRAALLVEASRIAADLVAAFELDSTESLDQVALAVSAITLAAELPQAVVDSVTPELMRDESAAVVVSLADAICAGRVRRETLYAEFSIPPSAEPGLLRHHASILVTAGLFGFMSPAVKAAKLYFASLQRNPCKLSKDEMATALIRTAEVLEIIAATDTDPNARRAFGAAYKGLSTDVDTALAAVAWAARVRSVLPRSEKIGVLVSAILLSGDPNKLRSLRMIASGLDFGTLRARLAQLPPEATSFADLAGQLVEQAKTLALVLAICRDCGVPASTRATKLSGICDALQATSKAARAAQVPAELDNALHGTCPAPLEDHGPFDAALRLAFSVARLSVPQTVREALWLTSPEALANVVVPAAGSASTALHIATGRWESLKGRLGLDERQVLGRRLGAATPAAVAARLSVAARNSGELGSWILYLRERKEVEVVGLKDLLRLWDSRILPCSLANAFDRVFYHAVARAAFEQYPELERFTGLSQQEARTRFKTLDAETSSLRRKHLANELLKQSIPIEIGTGKRSEFTDRSLILLEIGKQKRHIPIRQLLDRAGAAAQALKPCFMMSPLSVAQYLKPDSLRFDLLVIDEASQMRPEDAVGSVARCGQIVVVGDPKQLPPSTFFARSETTDDDDDSDEDVDAESILDLAQAVFRPMRRLRWHYRSRHGSLIAFSNREFYDDDLIVFPSPLEADATQGVGIVKVEGVYKARSNLAEVTAICAAATEHMRTCSGRSLGIATMNEVQRDLIALEMDRLAATQPEVEAYRERWSETLERFFIKNLENVQGDERDVIFISTVFGPAAQGGKVLQRFGPINGSSGHRRLNVLFTRAKHQVRLFTSMTPENVLAGPDSPRGAQVLKAYLAYAQTGRLDAGTETNGEADSDFEVFVGERLRIAGYDAVPQVGVAGFRIDLAVRDPRSPTTFLLGIECDGASYHSSRSARDRDVLRQQVLEGLGWTIYRIWSTDWYRDPEGQTRKLLSFIVQQLAKVS